MKEIFFLKNIKILSWNYDFQLELTAEFFSHEEFNTLGQVNRHKPPLIPYYPSVGYLDRTSEKEISTVHLNGIAGVHHDRHEKSIALNPFIDIEEGSIDQIHNRVFKYFSTMDHFLNFAWEKNPVSERGIKLAQDMINDTDIVIVIGYSFPFFNRDIDRKIFEVLKTKENLKIYYQDPYLDGQFLFNQFNLNKNTIVEQIKNVDQFYVPFEL